MKFDKSRLFTLVNADKVKVGSQVLVANNFESLKQQVENFPNMFSEIRTIIDIAPESSTFRFMVRVSPDTSAVCYFALCYFALCYLIKTSDLHLSCLDAAKRFASKGLDLTKKEIKYTDYKVGDIFRHFDFETTILAKKYCVDGEEQLLFMDAAGTPKWVNVKDLKLCEKVEKPTNNVSSTSTKLTEVMRQDDTSGILDLATLARNEAKDDKILTGWISVKLSLPPLDTIVYIRNEVDEHPVLARRVLLEGSKDWRWVCQASIPDNENKCILYTVSRRLSEKYYWKYIDLNKFTIVL